MTTGRAVLGLATLVAVGLYTGTRGPGQVLVEEGWEKSSKNVVFAMCAVPIFMIGTWALTSSGRRRGFTPFPTIGRILLMVATTLGPMTPIILTVTAAEPVQTTAIYVELGVAWLAGIAFLIWRRAGCFGYALGVVLAPVLALAVLFAAIGWLVFYICCVAFWASRTSCWVGLFHPLLAPALSAILAVYFTIDAVITLNTGGVPTNLWLALTFGGAISTLLLAIIEHEMLRRRDGYSWRGGPEPITR